MAAEVRVDLDDLELVTPMGRERHFASGQFAEERDRLIVEWPVHLPRPCGSGKPERRSRVEKSVTETSSPWPGIDAWLKKHAPRVFDGFRPPVVDETDVNILRERLCGVKLSFPEDLARFWRFHDGVIDEAPTVMPVVPAPQKGEWVRHFFLLGARETRMTHWAMADLGRDIWPFSRVPIGKNGAGDMLFIESTSDAVMLWAHDDPDRLVWIASSFDAWMQSLLDALRASAIRWDEEAQVLAFADRDPPAQQGSAERSARALLTLLVEHRLVAFSEDASSEGVLDSLRAVLTIRHSGARERALASFFEEHPSVEDYFLDDVTIGGLAREFGG